MLQIQYKIKTATEKEILLHLMQCSDHFMPPLVERVDIEEYSKKIVEKSVLFEAWSEITLVGLIASYMDSIKRFAFITNVSVINKFMGFGIASELLNRCICYAVQNNAREIQLEVHKNNIAAINLYRKNGFVQYNTKYDLLLMKLEIH